MRTVMKFGGSILSKEEELHRVAKVIKERRAKEEIVAVVSALKGITDSLIDAACAALENGEGIDKAVEAARETHLGILKGIRGKEIKEEAEKKVLEKITVIERALYGISYLKELSPRSLDLVQTMGERMSAPILEAYLRDNGIEAVSFDEAFIATNSEHGQGLPEMEETGKAIEEKVGKLIHNKVAVLPGFFGKDKGQNIVSFGRGGSDFSAAIVASSLGANALELWKDVDGFMTADPKIVQKAELLPNVSYDEAEELGYFGAKIIFPRTVPPLREKGTEIVIKNILSPEKTGTVVSGKREKHERIVKSIAVKRSTAAITLRSPAFVGQAGILEKIFSAMADVCVSVDLVATSETGVSFTVDEKDFEIAKQAIPKIDLPLENVEFNRDVALLGLVGEGLKRTPGIAGRVFSCLGKHGINVEMISMGSSEINMSFLIKEKDLEKAVKVLHEEIVEAKK
ncbi:MAG: aspartate kinase [Candidatus Diapherotrites archaeon]|uniref:Aspartokinase n=1 Tax=Candidatus Iainarchaeum sp. TaxID=3101447 RepID=A0A938YVY9_9ARCH|nr:aspartate kinase [Candidatus Diapherotrites archaeon]